MQSRSVLLLAGAELGWHEVRRTLDDIPHARVVDTATTTVGAAAAITRHCPDLVIAAASLGGACVATLLRTLRGEGLLMGRIALIADRYTHGCWDALADLDPDGLLLWGDLNAETLLPSLLLLLAGTLRLRSTRLAGDGDALSPRALALDERERMVLYSMAAGMTQVWIARAAGTTDRTVKRTLAALMERFGAASPFALGLMVARLGLLDVPIGTDARPEEDTHLSPLSLVPHAGTPQNGGRMVRIAGRG
jgi:DNA-binding NarL/FixJ family response regulator